MKWSETEELVLERGLDPLVGVINMFKHIGMVASQYNFS
jgi:hypothetical protein